MLLASKQYGSISQPLEDRVDMSNCVSVQERHQDVALSLAGRSESSQHAGCFGPDVCVDGAQST